MTFANFSLISPCAHKVFYVLTALFAAMYGAILVLDYGYGWPWAASAAKALSLQTIFERLRR